MKYFGFTGSLGHRCCLLDLLHLGGVCVYIYMLGYTLSKDSDLSLAAKEWGRNNPAMR